MKILYATTIGGTMIFFKTYIKHLIDEGHTVDIATNETNSKVPECYREWGCKIYKINTSRSPLNKGNLKAIKQLKEIVLQEKYDIVHCHTPVAAMCVRLACKKARKNGTKVIYTAHGFHFYKGAPLKNWLIFYPIEKYCSRFTDVLITINKEDYALAQKKMKARRIEYVTGVGIDLTKFGKSDIDKEEKRKELGIPVDATMLLSVGELNENKNHETVIRAIADLDVYYAIAGKGELKEHLENVIKELGLKKRVKLLGFRKDVAELYQTSDIYVLPSIREGLNVSIMEAMATGKPVICGQIRGNTDLIGENEGGFLCKPKDTLAFKKSITILTEDKKLSAKLGKRNKEEIKKYEINVVIKQMEKIYKEM